MNLIFIIFASLVILAAVVLSLVRRAQNTKVLKSSSPPTGTLEGFPNVSHRSMSLFPAQDSLQSNVATDAESVEQKRRAFLERATRGEREVLLEASADKNLYAEILDRLIDQTENDCEGLKRLADYIVEQGNLKGSERLAASVQNCWRRAPDRSATALTMRVAALSARPELFCQTAEAVCAAFVEDRIKGLSAGELRELIQSEYWLLDAEARRGGAGFQLKQEIKVLLEKLASHTQTERA